MSSDSNPQPIAQVQPEDGNEKTPGRIGLLNETASIADKNTSSVSAPPTVEKPTLKTYLNNIFGRGDTNAPPPIATGKESHAEITDSPPVTSTSISPDPPTLKTYMKNIFGGGSTNSGVTSATEKPSESAKQSTRSPLSKATRSVTSIAGCFVFFIVLIGILLLTGLDTMFIKLSLTGTVLDQSQQPIAAASVKMAGQALITDENGQFSISDLSSAEYQIIITADGFKQIDQTIALSRNFFEYGTQRTFTMEAASKSSFSGRFIAPDDPDYKFISDSLTAGNEAIPIATDGTFTAFINDEAGVLTFKSVNYKDIDFLNDGHLGDITLEPTGDVSGELNSFLTDELVLDADLILEGVDSSQLEIGDNGNFRYKDLTIGQTYTLRSSAPGYHTRDYQVTISQGDNHLENFSMIESGRSIFIRHADGEDHVFVSDYDGTSARQITLDDYDPKLVHLFNQQSTIGFVGSSTARGEDLYTSDATVPNVVNSTSGVDFRILQDLSPNFVAGKFSILYTPDNTNTNRLEIRNTNGEGIVNVIETTGRVIDPTISDNGDFLAYEIENDEENNGFYRFNIKTSDRQQINGDDVVTIYDISYSGSKVLYTAFNADLNTVNLKVANISTGENITLITGTEGHKFQFVDGSDSDIIFLDERNDLSNIYSMDVNSKQEQAVTRFGGITKIDQQGSKIYYYKNNQLYIIDLRLPIEGLLVTADVVVPSWL